MSRIFGAVILLIATNLSAQEKPVVVVTDTLIYLEEISKNPDAELVDLEDYVTDLHKDIRLATKNNPLKEALYKSNRVFVRRPVAVSLGFVQEALLRRGYGLMIFDAYRPWSVAERLFENETKELMENNLKHSRGASVDVSLISLETGEEVQMPGGYCQDTEASRPANMDIPEDVIENREILIETMLQHGFRVSPEQWWHFDFMGWQAFSVMDLTFEELENIYR